MIFVTSDWQLDDQPANEYRHEAIARLPAIAQKYGGNNMTVLIMGDLTEEKDNHPARLVNRMIDYVLAFTRVGRVYIIMGNHDYIDRRYPFFSFLSRIEGLNVTFVSESVIISAPSVGSKQVRYALIPHVRGAQFPWPGDLVQHEGYYQIFTHNTFLGAQGSFGGGFAVPRNIKCKIVSGDIHIPHVAGRVTYVGSPYTVDFGDDWDPRVLFIEGGKARNVAVPGPQKRLIDLDSSSDYKTRLKASIDNGHIVKGDMLRVRMYLSAETMMQWSRVEESVRKCCDQLGLKTTGGIEPVLPKALRKSIGTLVSADPTIRKDDGALIDDFAEARKLDDRTTATGHSLANKV